jgi:hypothetical protein
VGEAVVVVVVVVVGGGAVGVVGVESFIFFFFSKQNISSKEIFEDLNFILFSFSLRDTIEQETKYDD